MLIFQKRFLDEIPHPLGTRNDSKVLVDGKQRLLKMEVLTRAVYELIPLRTVTTFRLPLHAIMVYEVIAMTCKCPTIMKSPYHLNICLIKIFK